MSIGQEHIGPNTVHTIKVVVQFVHRNEETIPILKLDGILSYFFITDHGGTVDESKLRTQLQYHFIRCIFFTLGVSILSMKRCGHVPVYTHYTTTNSILVNYIQWIALTTNPSTTKFRK